MKQNFLLIVLAAVIFTSCSTAYKTGQTPDDVYFVPTKKVPDEAVVKNDNKDDDRYEDNTSSQEDRYLRMKVRNRNRWSRIDDYDYWNDTRYYGYTDYSYSSNWYYWNNWNSPYYTGYNNHCCCYSNSSYNPYYTGYIVHNPVVQSTTVRPNLGSYSNHTYNNTNPGLGGSIKKVFSTSEKGRYSNTNRSSGDSYKSADRTYSPSSSSGSSSSSGKSSGSVSRPGRP